jgi:cytochrome c553
MPAVPQLVRPPAGGTRRAMLDTLLRALPMVRLRVTAALGVLLATGACAGDITVPGGDDAAVAAAKAKFSQDVLPVLNGFCGACHTGMPNIDFMLPDPDIRSRMLAWPNLVSLPAPTSSKLLTQGPHSGPGLTPDQSAIMLDWIELEVIAAGGEPAETVETDRVSPRPGANTIDLTPLGLTGSRLTFVYEPLATGMYLSDLRLHGGSGGIHIINPLFVIWDGGQPTPDPINRFGNVDLTVLEGEDRFVGGGTAVFVDVTPGSDLSVHFRVAEFADGTDPGGDGIIGGGCNNVASFTQNARAPLAAACNQCHGVGGQASAIAATDMRQINDLTADGQAAVCAQIKTRVNTLQPEASGLFIAPDPASGTGHPFKFGSAADFQAFRNNVILWINNE